MAYLEIVQYLRETLIKTEKTVCKGLVLQMYFTEVPLS